jgi:hypothetical protein
LTSFTEATGTPTTRSVHNVLGPLLHSKHGSQEPRRIALKVITRGLAARFSPATIRTFLENNAPDEIKALVDSSFTHLVSVARQHIPEGKARHNSKFIERAATRMLVRISTTLPAGSGIAVRSEINCRIAYAVIAIQQIRLMRTSPGWDRIMATEEWLGTQMNLSGRNARRILLNLEKLG